jgi:hypothetical protein
MCQGNTVTCRRGGGGNLNTITFIINGTSYGDWSVDGTIGFRCYFKRDGSINVPLHSVGVGSVVPTSSTVGGLQTQVYHRPHIQEVPGFKVTISGYNSGADSESKTSYSYASHPRLFRSYEFLKHGK